MSNTTLCSLDAVCLGEIIFSRVRVCVSQPGIRVIVSDSGNDEFRVGCCIPIARSTLRLFGCTLNLSESNRSNFQFVGTVRVSMFAYRWEIVDSFRMSRKNFSRSNGPEIVISNVLLFNLFKLPQLSRNLSFYRAIREVLKMSNPIHHVRACRHIRTAIGATSTYKYAGTHARPFE